MTREELQQHIAERFPDYTFEEGGEWLNVQITPESWHSFAQYLCNSDEMFCDFLFCLTCVDWKTHLTMVYHLTSTRHRHTLVVKAKLERENPEIETAAFVWRTAEFHEREVFELFGVKFKNHPDLRNLILPDEWEGFPLRKDYEDAVNMIKL